MIFVQFYRPSFSDERQWIFIPQTFTARRDTRITTVTIERMISNLLPLRWVSKETNDVSSRIADVDRFEAFIFPMRDVAARRDVQYWK